MQLSIRTVSLCNTCYKEIPSVVTVDGSGAIITKHCAEHGNQSGMVERDPVFYTYIRGINSQGIYPGHFVDVTRQCNLRCKYCFYALEQHDPEGEYTIDKIVEECLVNFKNAPFILTGGEPTTRNDLLELIDAVQKVGPVELLTNGVNMAKDEDLFYDVIARIKHGNIINLNLSVHPQTEAWKEVLKRCALLELKVESVLIVIDSKEQFFDALKIVEEWKDTVAAWRIKAATSLWAETKPESKIFTSDMLGWLDEAGGYQIITGRNNKTSIVNVVHNGAVMMMVSWYDVTNVDLNDIDCAPYYRARNGEVKNFVTSCLINEGIGKGWMKGMKL